MGIKYEVTVRNGAQADKPQELYDPVYYCGVCGYESCDITAIKTIMVFNRQTKYSAAATESGSRSFDLCAKCFDPIDGIINKEGK